MKTAIVLFKTPSAPYDGEYVKQIVDLLLVGGYPVDTIETLSTSDDLGFMRVVSKFKDTVDNLIIINNPELTFSVKQIISDQTETSLAENDNAIKILENLSKAHGKEYSQENAVIPIESTLIPNLMGAFQGFMLDDNEFTLVLLPNQIDECKVACEKYLLPYLNNKYSIDTERLVLKYFGAKDKLENAVQDVKACVGGNAQINLRERNGDWTITVIANSKDCKEIARSLVGNLKENLYAEFETTLGERLFDLLKLKNLKIATAESFTGGRVVGAIISNVGASSYVHEGIVSYSNESKSARLSINPDELLKEGAVSSMTAYRMCAGLLKTGSIDVAISTTGYAGPKMENSNEPVGLAYVGVGMMDGIHTYKLNLSGSREEITETAKNTALFLAIKKLKSIK